MPRKSWSEKIGLGNPEAHDYAAGFEGPWPFVTNRGDAAIVLRERSEQPEHNSDCRCFECLGYNPLGEPPSPYRRKIFLAILFLLAAVGIVALFSVISQKPATGESSGAPFNHKEDRISTLPCEESPIQNIFCI